MDQTLTLEQSETRAEEAPEPRPPGRARRALASIGSGLGWAFGAASLVVGLSALAAVPVAQFLSLGYLLEAAGRVARGGRLCDGWIGVRRAGKIGEVVAGCWLTLLPARLVSSLATSAELIDPDGPVALRWWAGLLVVSGLTAAHLVASCARGGRLRHFAWPPGGLLWLAQRVPRGGLHAEARDATWDFVAGLRLPHYFRLGLLGFLGALVWLAVPASLMALGPRAPLLGFAGALGLGFVAPSVAFLQVRLAAEGRFGAIFEVRAVRERFRRAPWAFATAWLLTAASAVPLYLLKVEAVPREAAWLPGLLFVAFLLPARLACGWAYARGGRREARRHWLSRGLGRLGMLPAAAACLLIVFLAQYTSWGGSWTLYEQHAFLLPAPFLGF